MPKKFLVLVNQKLRTIVWGISLKPTFYFEHLTWHSFFFFNYSTCSTLRSSQIRIRRSLLPDRPARIHLRVLPPSRGVAIAQTTDFAQRFRRAAFRAFVVLQVMQLLRQILVKKLNSLTFSLNKVAYPTISLKLFIAYTIDRKYLDTCGYLVRIECYLLLLFSNFL